MTNEFENDLPETDELLRELNTLLQEEDATPQSEDAPSMEEAYPEEYFDDDPYPEEKPARKKRIGKIVYYSLNGLFSTVFIVSGIYLISYFVQSKEQTAQYDDLASRVESIRKEQLENTGNSSVQDATDPDSTEYTGPYADILPEYRDVYAQNNDLVGWIKIDGTAIDYPVMQTPNNKDYYLDHDFNHQASTWKYIRSCIYVRESCDVFTPSDNVTIYGHYMQDGTMFHDLHGYYSSSFYKEHQYIQFDTIYERHTYQIIGIFKTSANVGEGFAYHLFDYATSEAEFNTFIDTVQSLQLYWTGVDAEYGDMLITLSTCEYSQDNGRLVVVAKRIS